MLSPRQRRKGLQDWHRFVQIAAQSDLSPAHGAPFAPQEWYGTAAAGVAEVDDVVISTLKSESSKPRRRCRRPAPHSPLPTLSTLAEGVSFVVQYETASIAAAVGLTALILPGPRRLLWRATFGRFQSAESLQAAAEARLTSLAQAIDAQGGEAEQLAEKLAAARADYAAAASTLRSAASDMRSFAGKVEGTEQKVEALMRDLRELRSKHALQMRSDAAVHASAAARQRAAVDKVVSGLAKDGF